MGIQQARDNNNNNNYYYYYYPQSGGNACFGGFTFCLKKTELLSALHYG